jgi:uncharacterized protein YyaL (SSP411 family)
MDSDAFYHVLGESKSTLLETRNRRPPTLRDEKILTAWNGLMISAFARAGLVLGDTGYTERAAAAARFVDSHLLIDERLRRSYLDGQARHNAFLEDYAFLAAGYLDLFEATQELKWLHSAIALERTLAAHYEDPQGAFFATSNDHEQMIAREKPNYDGAVPSGNSVAAMNLLRLGTLTSSEDYTRRAQKTLMAFAKTLETHPTSMAALLPALDFFLGRPKEIAIVTPAGQLEAADPFLDQLRRIFLPNRAIVVAAEGRDQKEKSETLTMLENRPALNEAATVYVCERNTCQTPTTDPEEFKRQLV